jgi:hypothetical protein
MRFLLIILVGCGDATTTTPSDDGAVNGDGAMTSGDSAMPADDGAMPGTDGGGQDGSMSSVNPPLGGSSGGSGGSNGLQGTLDLANGIEYRLIVPASPMKPSPIMIVFSGTEGGQNMTMNLLAAGPSTGTDKFIRAVLDGVLYNGNGGAGVTVLDYLRGRYDIDNDRTYLLGESAGTTAALQLGFHMRQSYFGAYWANDVNNNDKPGQTAAQLGFAPWGQVGPGGDFGDANIIASGMKAAGYRTPNPCPYSGAGSGTHGDPNQFLAALQFFPGKSRQ